MLVFFPLESEGAATVRPDCVRSSPPLPDRRLLPASSLPQSVRCPRLGFGGGAAVAGGAPAAALLRAAELLPAHAAELDFRRAEGMTCVRAGS
jgi:hypothetical protein